MLLRDSELGSLLPPSLQGNTGEMAATTQISFWNYTGLQQAMFSHTDVAEQVSTPPWLRAAALTALTSRRHVASRKRDQIGPLRYETAPGSP